MRRPIDPFRPREIEDADTAATDQELAAASLAARQVEAATVRTRDVQPSAGLTDRIMAAVAREPSPRPAGFLAVVRADRSLAGVVRSLGAAWTVVVGPRRPVRARAVALAYVLALVLATGSVTGIAGYGAAGALQWLAADHRPGPSPSGPVLTSPNESPIPESAEPSAEPSESEDSSEAPGSSGGPSAEPSDDHSQGGGTSGPTPTDDHGISGDGSSATSSPNPEASGTPKPSSTPKATETPSPTSSPGG